MKVALFSSVLSACLTLFSGHGIAADLARAVLDELNAARTAPCAYAAHLRTYRAHITGKYYIPPGSRVRYTLNEGAAAVDEAIRFLERQKPLPALGWSDGLAEAARELNREQAKSGFIGHGSGGSALQPRLERHGRWQRTIGENISYGPDEARAVVMQLIIDDGVPDRGHRNNIFAPDFGMAGIACGPHPVRETSCVIEFAGVFSK